MKKKILSLVLALAMVVSLFPGMSITADAEGGGVTELSSFEVNIDLDKLILPGDCTTENYMHPADAFSFEPEGLFATSDSMRVWIHVNGGGECLVGQCGHTLSDDEQVFLFVQATLNENYQFTDGDPEVILTGDAADVGTVEEIYYNEEYGMVVLVVKLGDNGTKAEVDALLSGSEGGNTGGESGKIENLGEGSFSVDEEGNVTFNTPADDGYFYYTEVIPTAALEGSGITAEQYVQYYMEGTKHSIINVTDPTVFNLSDMEAVAPLAHSGTGQVYVTNVALTGTNPDWTIDSDSIIAVLKLRADNMVSGAYGAQYFPGLNFENVYAYGIHGVYADVEEFEGNGGGDNNKVNNVTVDINWDKIAYNIEGYPELHTNNVILTPDVAGAIDLEYSYFNWVYYDEAEGGEWYSLDFIDLPDNDPMVGIMVYFNPLEGYEFGSNLTVSCEDYDVVTEFDPYEAGIIIKLGNVNTALSGIKPYTPPTLAAVDATLYQEPTFAAIVDGETLPDLDQLVDRGILSGEFTLDNGTKLDIDWKKAQWVYAPIGSENLQEVPYDHEADTSANIYLIEITLVQFGTEFVVPSAVAQGSGINIKNEEGKVYAKNSFKFVRFEAAETQNSFIAVVMPASDEPTPPTGGIILPPVGGSTGGSNNPENVTTGSNTETPVPTTETTAKPSVSGAGSNPTATVTDKMGTTIVDQAKENNSDTVVIAPKFNGSDDSASVVIPTKTVNELGRETNADLVVETPVATVTFGNSDLTTLGRPGGNVVITTEKVPGGVALDVTVNGQSMPSIPGGVLVNIPEENLTPGTVAMIVHEDGTRELVRKSVADVPDQTMFVPLEGSATVIIVDNAQKFDDVQERNWFSDAVAFASGHELFRGISATEFGPNVSTTRGMLATVIYRMENEPNFTGNDLFGDMSGKEYYAEAAAWAASKGIVTGYSANEFGGDDAITREQLATMLWRYVGTPMSYHSVSRFNDADEISSYAEIAVAWANEMGIMNGRNGVVLDPKGEATRAEVAQMLMNFMALIAN